MERFTTMEEVEKYRMERGICGAITRALRGEEEIAHPEPYDPDRQGSIWLLCSSDNDQTVASIFGKSLMELSFDDVRYYPEEEHFLCLMVRTNSQCDSLIIPDMHWLRDDWHEWLLAQL